MEKSRPPQVTRPWKHRQLAMKVHGTPAHPPAVKQRRTLARNPKRG